MTTVSNRAYTHDLRERLRSWQGSPTCPITILARAKSPTPAQVSAALANLRELKPATPADQKHLRETIEMVKKLAPMPSETATKTPKARKKSNPSPRAPSIEQTQRKILEHDMDERRPNPATISGKIPSQLRQPLVSA